jgi:hypothetical protein
MGRCTASGAPSTRRERCWRHDRSEEIVTDGLASYGASLKEIGAKARRGMASSPVEAILPWLVDPVDAG